MGYVVAAMQNRDYSDPVRLEGCEIGTVVLAFGLFNDKGDNFLELKKTWTKFGARREYKKMMKEYYPGEEIIYPVGLQRNGPPQIRHDS